MSEPKVTDKELFDVENYMGFNFNYSNNFILPHKEALQLLAAMGKAERTDSEIYNMKGGAVVFSNKPVDLDMCYLTKQAYRKGKMAYLLGINPEEIE